MYQPSISSSRSCAERRISAMRDWSAAKKAAGSAGLLGVRVRVRVRVSAD
jgi:hypothetical protein